MTKWNGRYPSAEVVGRNINFFVDGELVLIEIEDRENYMNISLTREQAEDLANELLDRL